MVTGQKARSLKTFVLMLAGGSLVAFAAIFLFIFHTSMPKMLVQSENEYLNKQTHVVQGLLNSTRQANYLLAEDTAIWDETVFFAQGKNPDYFSNNWPDTSLLGAFRLNFAIIKDLKGNDLYSEYQEFQNSNLPLDPNSVHALPDGLSTYLNKYSQQVLNKYQDPATLNLTEQPLGLEGIVFYGGVAYDIAVVPIVSSRDSTNPAGTIILGNVLTDNFLKKLTFYESLYFEFTKPDQVNENEAPQLSNLAADPGSQQAIDRISDSKVSTELLMQDIDGQYIVLKMTDGRAIYTEGEAVLDRTGLLLALLTVIFALSLYFIFVRFVLNPLEKLSEDLGQIDESESLEQEKYSNTQEFGSLTNSINQMRSNLVQSKVSIDVLEHILNGLDAYIYVSDPATDQILFINQKMKEHFGLGNEKIEGQICWKVLQSGITERCSFCPIPPLQAGEELVVWEEHNTLTNRYYRNNDSLIEWSDGHLAHLQHSVDITSLKAAEVNLRKRLEQQELMSAMALSFISAEDTESLINNALAMAGEFMNLSKVVLARFNKKNNTLDAEYVWYNPKHECPQPNIISLPFKPGSPEYDAYITRREQIIVHKDITGVPEYAYAQNHGLKALIGVPLYASGEFWGMLSFDDCTTAREWTESDSQLTMLISGILSGVINRNIIEESLHRMSSIVNSYPQLISYASLDGEFEYLSPGGVASIGYTPEELIGKNVTALFSPENGVIVRDKILPKIKAKGSYYFEMPVIRKDGESRIMSFYGFKTDFKIPGLGAVATDITEKRQLEKELTEAKELAEKSSLAKSEFLSRMSHEMRTPLNAIIGMTHIAQSSKDIEKKQYCLEKIDDASTHLLGVINDILDMSKIEASKFELSNTEFEFEKMLMRIINVVNFRVDEKNQNLIINVDPNLPHSLVSDEQRLAQVIANLLSNAVKFTPEMGTITLSAKLVEEEGNNCTIQIDVADTGIGITSGQQNRLFRSFEQADGGISRKFGGTGLGLAISKSIVSLMNGDIWVESEIGKGSTFAFKIEVKRGSSQRPKLLSPSVNWKNLRILVVDDAPEVRDYFLNFAQTIDLDCDVAADGYAACELIEQNRDNEFNIVFVDWKMPGMNGIELTKKIKDNFGAKIVVIMISATQWSDIEDDAKNAGVDGFVPKPLFTSLIMDCINECLGVEQANIIETNQVNCEDGCFAGYHVLLAEDVEINREILAALLEHTGVLIESAENGAVAYEMFKSNPEHYDLIFMDIHMPEMDGYEATTLIRELDMPKAKTIPIVAMTANVFREDIERCLAVGMNGHLGKPIDSDEIIAKMKEYLV